MKYKDGIKGIKYRLVPSTWRNYVSPRNIKNRKSPTNPMVIDLLAGKTVFAFEQDRKTLSFGSLYAVAASNSKNLRMYTFDDLDNGIYKGYLIWMESKQ